MKKRALSEEVCSQLSTVDTLRRGVFGFVFSLSFSVFFLRGVEVEGLLITVELPRVEANKFESITT